MFFDGAEGRHPAGEEALDQFAYARAARAPGHKVGLVLDRWQGVGDGHREAARLHESMIVLGVAHGYDIVSGQTKIIERRVQPARLVDVGRQDHHSALVENDLQLQSEVPDRLEDGFFMGLPGRDNGAANIQRGDARGAKPFDETLRRFGRQGLFLLARGRVEQRAVFRDNSVEEIEAGKTAGEVRQFAAGDENQLSAGAFEVDQRPEGRIVHDAVVGDGAVVIRCEADDVHCRSHGSTRRRASRFRRGAVTPGGGMPRFSANLGFLFTDQPFLDRFAAAANVGFKGVEYMSPYEHDPKDIARRLADHGLTQALFNLPAGDWAAGERGLAILPEREDEFRDGLKRALDYAEALGCERLNCLAGDRAAACRSTGPPVVSRKSLLRGGRVGRRGVKLLIEPINNRDMPGFYLNRTDEALRLIGCVKSDNLYLQADIYHMQIMEGDLARRLEAAAARIAHIQIADNPGRHEPGTGEINFPFLFCR